TNPERLGLWPNWRQAAERLLELSPAPFLLLCEDDIRLRRDAALALAHAADTLPHDDWGVVSLFTPWQHLLHDQPPVFGWQAIDVAGNGWGAQAYCFTRESLRAVLDATAGGRLAELRLTDRIVTSVLHGLGRKCYFHVPSLCDHTGEGFSSVGHHHPHGMQAVAFDPGRAEYEPDLSAELPGKLAVLTAYFNPAGSSALRRNYERFAAAIGEQGGELWTAEVAFGEAPFELNGPRVLRLRAADVLWHKEAALNRLVRELPPGYDKVAWVDADILFDNPGWLADAARLLRRYPVVQCFEEVVYLDPQGRPSTTSRSAAKAAADGRPAPDGPAEAHPGHAWAARRELLERFGLYAHHVLGLGDAMMIPGLLGWWDYYITRHLGPPVQEHLRGWAESVWPEVQGQVGCVPGRVRHLHHGPAERGYTEAARELTRLGFDPARDLAPGPDGLPRWATDRPALRALVAHYFDRRADTPPVPGGALPPAGLTDCLARTVVRPRGGRPRAARAVATVASAGYAEMLDSLLTTLARSGGCPDALRVVFVVGDDPDCRAAAKRHGAAVIPCEPAAELSSGVKSVLYSAARFIDADRLLCLDADMLVLGELGDLFRALGVCAPGSILAARNDNARTHADLAHVFADLYGGTPAELAELTGGRAGAGAYPLVVNDGLFAGTREALLALDACVRSMPAAVGWVDRPPVNPLRNQFVFNLALAVLGCGVEIDPVWNLQLHAQEAVPEGDGLGARWRGREVRVLHFSGAGRPRYADWRARLQAPPPAADGPTSN
ncbi:MAG TPA: hypothetical protein VIL46_02120, partial [Gemmataceae bacterium]